jgi:hypothetical protein
VYLRFAYFFAAAFCFAHRAFCAAAILARPSALIRRRRFLGAPVETDADFAGLSGPRLAAVLLLNNERTWSSF